MRGTTHPRVRRIATTFLLVAVASSLIVRTQNVLTTHAASREPVRARHGIVASTNEVASNVGVDIMKRGGNAVDAAIAVGFALAVTHPAAGNLGGGGFLLARFADGRTAFIDFRERAPEKASRNMYIGPDGKATADSLVGYRA